jgi:hypothetical protein
MLKVWFMFRYIYVKENCTINFNVKITFRLKNYINPNSKFKSIMETKSASTTKYVKNQIYILRINSKEYKGWTKHRLNCMQ